MDGEKSLEAEIDALNESAGHEEEEGYDKFKFRLYDLLAFIFPKSKQHPLAATRLHAFGMCGPLDENGKIRTGIRGSRILATYELDQMCMQYEKEDLLQIYSHRARDVGLLTSEEQSSIVNQADAHLKKAKGKASLPVLTRHDIIGLFDDLERDQYERISFHDAQEMIFEFRRERIKQYKLVFPNITTKKEKAQAPQTNATFDESVVAATKATVNTLTKTKKKKKNGRMPLIGGLVSDAVAPRFMFKAKEGYTNPDMIALSTKLLSLHASKLTDIDQGSSTEMIANIRLLREVPPFCKDPYDAKAKNTGIPKIKWDETSQFTGTGLGSMVKAPASASNRRRKVTLY